jgi:hypothetical protein
LVDAFDQVSNIIDSNKDHKGVQEAVRFFDIWMRQATFSDGLPVAFVPAARHLSRLHHANVNPLDLLKVVASVWLYYHLDEHRRMVRNDAHCQAIMGHKVCVFLPISDKSGFKRPMPKERKEAGKYIQENVGPLLANVVRAVDQYERKQKERFRNMTEELVV